MTLAFPNPSRSFDPTRNVIRFTGYDGMFEVAFVVEASALAQPRSDLRSETAREDWVLGAFDAVLTSIHHAARKAYAAGRRTTYVLTADDIR